MNAFSRGETQNSPHLNMVGVGGAKFPLHCSGMLVVLQGAVQIMHAHALVVTGHGVEEVYYFSWRAGGGGNLKRFQLERSMKQTPLSRTKLISAQFLQKMVGVHSLVLACSSHDVYLTLCMIYRQQLEHWHHMRHDTIKQ